MRAFLHTLNTWLLGTERHQRMRVKMTLIALYGYVVSTALLFYGMDIDLVNPRHGWWLIAYIWTGVPVFYLLVRTGWASRLGNPSLDLHQSLYALVAILGAYVITGPVRNSVLMLMCLVLVFGMFTMSARQVMLMGLLFVCCLGSVQTIMVLANPGAFDVRIEVVKFILAACTLPAVSAVSIYVSQVRARLIEQKEELAHALAMLQDIASRDELTRLVNRRHMQERVTQEADRQLRSNEAFCLALIDLDHFKRINDLHGHAMGDMVLKEFARLALEGCRKTDVLARWGGEEFLMLMPAETLDGAQAALQRIREHLDTSMALSPGLSGLQVTFSAGLTDHPAGEPLHETLERADRALYTAKEGGRNRTVVTPAMGNGATSPPFADLAHL
ncbi:diguanylate cyclase [Aquabacterium sp.]|uniref:sensor domain-containing diguanylate cyclase n=1 Tax=Aquabacterium sp. TaxID=1872578 RepID=UPI0035B15A6C